MMSRASVFLGLGSNVGDKQATLEKALGLLERRGLRITARSACYLTEPVGGPAQPWFLNQVVRAETDLSADELLARCQAIEAELGRVREVRYGPRTLDIDLLLFGDLVRRTPQLTLPHPRLHERLFVLIPLCELAPEARHPLLGLTAAELRERCRDASRVLLHEREGARG